MGDISENFDREEFSCKCGCGFNTVDVQLLRVLEDTRFYWDRPVIISSGCRCEEHNKRIGGHPNSGHMRAESADIYVVGITPLKIYNWLDNLYPNSLSLGNGKTFTHIGMGNTRKRWNY